MTLAAILQEKLASWQPETTGRQTFAHVDEATGVATHLSIDQQDRLSCSLWEAHVTRPAAATAAEPSLAAWAQRIASKTTGLLETLSVIEVDAERGQAMLRSQQPALRADDRFYYEVFLTKTGTATLRRYKGAVAATPREQIAFTLTHEATGKVIGDLAG